MIWVWAQLELCLRTAARVWKNTFLRRIEIEKCEMKSELEKSIQQLCVKEHFETYGDR